jgi:hypothetical protein
LWLVTAGVCVYVIGYRFYAAWITARVLTVDATRATPAERLNDGRDFVPTHRWIVFGHHFAAIAGPGPLVGPTLAAQFGYLPGTLWILFARGNRSPQTARRRSCFTRAIRFVSTFQAPPASTPPKRFGATGRSPWTRSGKSKLQA